MAKKRVIKKRRKGGKKSRGAGLKVVKRVRLSQRQVLQVKGFTDAGDTEGAHRAVRLFRPELTPGEVEEVAFRIADPVAHGGIITGSNPEIGDYADIALTR